MSKRRRTEDTSDAEVYGPFERPEKLWLEDGSVVLQAGDLQFKVHRSILAKHSSFFADLFRVPQPANGPMLDGCPLVHLQDSAEDVKHVLLKLYGDREYTNNDKVPHFLVVAAMLRLGKKYEVDHLKDDALARLKGVFPTTLAGYYEVHESNYGGTHFNFPSDGTYTTYCKKLCAAVRLAQECGLQTILPSLYMEFMDTDVDELLHLPLAGEHSISYDALSSCVHAREKLIEARTQHVYGWIREVGTLPSCKSKHKCNSASRKLVGYVWDSPLHLRSVFYDWDTFKADLTGEEALEELCDPCLQYAKKAHSDGQKDVWKMLPAYFRLPPWKDLKDEV